MVMTLAEAIDSLAAQGLDDWVPLHDVVWHARQLTDVEGDLPAKLEALVRTLVERNLMCPGDLESDGVAPWMGSPVELARRVVDDGRRLDREPMGAGCWFANTPAGDAQGRRAQDVDQQLGSTQP